MSQYRLPYKGNSHKKKGGFYSSGINQLLNRLDKLEHQVFCCSDDTDEVIAVTDAAYNLKKNQDGVFLSLDRAAGIEVVLPQATADNIGWNCKIAVKTTFTGTMTISAGSTSDLLIGGLQLVDPATAGDTLFVQPDVSNDDQIVADADTKGRLAGGIIEVKIVAANRVFVSGTLVGDGALATPFA